MSVRVAHKIDPVNENSDPAVRVTREYMDMCMDDDRGAGYDLTIVDHAAQKIPLRYSLIGQIRGFGEGYGLYSNNTAAQAWLMERLDTTELVFDSENDFFCCKSDDVSLIMLCIEHLDACINGYEKLPTKFEL